MTNHDIIIPSHEDMARVKGLGFLRDKTTPNCFNCRVITRNGKITADEATVIAEAAKRYGNGEVAMTTRQTIEIQCVPYENVDPLVAFLRAAGLETGGTGAKVRPIVSCKGTTCVFGLIDTYELSLAIHERFYRGYHGVKLPHKFKIAVGGCPNKCVKPDLNDLGVIGQRVPKVDRYVCRGCKVCQVEKVCPMGAATLHDGKLSIDRGECINCGRCIPKCPFGAVTEELTGYRVYIGGRWGKKSASGIPLSKIFETQDEVLDVVEKTILFFRENGRAGERFADTIARIGFDVAEKEILSDAILSRKEAILSKE